MPPSPDQASSQQQPAVEIDSYYQEEASRKPSPSRKGHGKGRKKHETIGEDPERSPRGPPQELTSPPSILSQLHASMAPPPTLSNGVLSPRLEAWDASPSTRPSDTPAQSTTEWAQGIPYGRSPPREYSNGVSRAGSPPEYRPPLDPELRGGFSPTSPPTSPRAVYRQPVQRTNDYQSFGDYLGSSPNNRRPLSMHSQSSHYPPPPHHQQAHYYTAPEIDLGHPKPVPEDRMPGEGFCCVFDSLPPSGHEASGNPENVLLVGFEHGLNIYHIGKKRFDPVGRLDGLRGSVVGAKVLHFQCISDLPLQPLVAVIVHGPYIPSGAPSRLGTNAVLDEFEPSESEMQALQAAAITHYQTTVEIYSLKKGQHLGTLFRSPKVEIKGGRLHTMPPPVGDLSIHAKGKFLVISSGISGEVFIFERILHRISETSPGFRCLGKVWTRTGSRKTRSVSTSSNESGPARLHDALAAGTRRSNAIILSLSNRWLAVAPPSSSAQTTLHGEIEPDNSGHKAPGVSSHAPATEPQISCDLDSPEGEGILNKAARDIAQGLLKTAQWVGLEGKQAWSNYWSKPSDQGQQGAAAPPSNPDLSALPNHQSFPPTHANDYLVNRAKNQPALVSILDLEKLSKSQHSKTASVLQPLATFSLPTGCSLLSFSPNGLHLLTASAKGDVEHVWDLMRMVHGEAGRAGDPDPSPKGPSVRQIAKITRMTEARIVDVVWTEPQGERLAIITDRGTVHINDLPSSAFLWPPSRRTLRSSAAASTSSATGVQTDDSARPVSAGAGSGFSSAFGMFTGKTQPLIDAVRGRRPSIGSGFSGFGGMALTAGISAKSGRVVAAGFNRSVGAAAAGTVNTIRHLGENRIALPSSQSAVVPGCVRWLSGKGLGRIAITGGGIVRIYSIRQSSNSKARQRRPSVFGDRPVEFSLPKEPSPTQHVMSNQHPNARSLSQPSTPRGSFWLPQSPLPVSSTSKLETHPLSYAELDTSLAYQPFHTDRRVNLYVYSDEVTTAAPANFQGTTTWVFGEPIPATKISVGSTGHEEDDAGSGQAGLPRMENVISMKGNADEGQHIVVTTRRKLNTKGEATVAGTEDEIFEDDCEILDFRERV